MESSPNIDVDANKKRNNWTDNDVLVLIHVWSEFIDELRANKRNKKVYIKMAQVLGASAECARSPEEIKNKLGNLTRDYRREKARLVSGASPSTWKFFNPVNSLLGCLPSNNDDLLDDSLSLPVINEEEITLDESYIEEGTNSNNSWSFGSEETNSAGSSSGSSGFSLNNRRRAAKRPATEDVTVVLKDLLQEQKRANDQAKDSEMKALELLQKDSENQQTFQNNVLNLLTNLLQKK